MKRLFSLFIILIVIFFSFVGGVPAFAHPHVFVDCRICLICDGDMLKRLSLNWEFDSMFSSLVLDDYDADHDGTLSADELEKYRQSLMSELTKANFFSYIRKDGRIVPVKKIDSLRVSYDDPAIVVDLDIPVNMKIGAEEKQIGIEVYDREYYIAFRYGPDDEVSQEGGDMLNISYDIFDDPDRTYYMGQVVPEEVVLYLSKG